MTSLPVVERELRVRARRGHTYWTRFLTAVAAVGVAVWIWGWLTEGRLPHERGLILFQVIAGLAFAYAILAGIGVTADCLSEEKREGTLGLLFLTDLKSYDVVLGKLAATSLNALYRLFSVYPILAIPLLMGALTLAEFWRMALVLTNSLFFSLAAGLFVSSISRQERRAMAGTLLLILLVTTGPPLVGWITQMKNQALPYDPVWLLSSALFSWTLAFDVAYRVRPEWFWAGVLTTHLCGWVFLVSACAAVRWTWQDRPAVGRSALRREHWRAWQFGHGAARVAFRRRLLAVNPILWLVGRDRLRPMSGFVLLAGLGVAWLWLYWKQGGAMLDQAVYLLTAYCLHTVLKIWLASEACRPLAEERRTGTLEPLLSTPLSVSEILEGEMLALQRQFAWPVILVLGADFLMLLNGLRGQDWQSPNDWVFPFLGIMIVFIADLYTLAWVGFWLSLTRKANRAFIGTVLRVLVVPWAVLVLGLTFFSTLPPQTIPIDLEGQSIFIVAFAVALVNDAVFLLSARLKLLEQFRLVATQRFQSRTESAWPSLPSSAPADAPALSAR